MMNRVIRVSMFFAVFLALAAGSAFAQTSRTFMERRVWYVDPDGKTGEAIYWRVVLGTYDEVTVMRRIPGEGDMPVKAAMNFQLISSGYIEGNGHSPTVGRLSIQPNMRIKLESGEIETIMIDAIDYIYDYGTKVALKDGRKGEFLMQVDNTDFEVRRFQFTEFRAIAEELREVIDRMPIVALAFSREALPKARAEPVTDLD